MTTSPFNLRYVAVAHLNESKTTVITNQVIGLGFRDPAGSSEAPFEILRWKGRVEGFRGVFLVKIVVHETLANS